MLDIASALWSGTIDDYAWGEISEARRLKLSDSEIVERDLQSRY